ncbi:MAG: hypothetical protein U0271_13945 [Polyangiaceae bacterium]
MRRVVQIVLVTFAASMIVLALSRAPDANASVAYTSPYTFEQTYSTSLRLLRVDMGLKITERDKELGYIMFEYTSPESGNKICQGTIELVESKNGVHVAVTIPQMPQYHERMIVDQLSKKLNSEYGDPPSHKKDKDKDGDSDKDKNKDKDKDKDGDSDKDKDGDSDKDKDKDKDKD